MTVSEKDFLKSAKELVNTPSSEMDYRNAASRAYYSSLHSCMKIVVTFPTIGDTSKGGVHAQAIDQLLNPPTSVSKNKAAITKKAGHILRHMKTIRTKADYYINNDFKESQSDEVFMYNERLETIIDSYFK